MASFLFTSESVSEGHPDKICDQISDGVLDKLLAQDRSSRVACEALVKTGLVVLAGEVTSSAQIDYGRVVREVITDIGYTDSSVGFDAKSCGVLTAIEEQSDDIAIGVDEGSGLHEEQGAGDQGIVFGYACDETSELMPATISYAHALLRNLADKRRRNEVDFLRPDAKSQVTARYVDGQLQKIDSVVVSTQHHPETKHQDLRSFVIEECIKKVLPSTFIDDRTKFYINPTGRFVVGGPQGDCGLTGRKIVVDTYGGHCPHGGGAFSGKDPTKVDRSACYVARYVAKNLVAAGICRRCLVQLSYVIGMAEPVSIFVETYGTERQQIDYPQLVREIFPLKPKEIIEVLNLRRPIYRQTASYGHFGRENFPWEKTDLVDKIKEKVFS